MSLMPSGADWQQAAIHQLCAQAKALIEQQRFAEARVLLEKARANDPASSQPHYYLGLLHADLGELTQAVAALDRCLQLGSDNSKAHNNRGAVLHRLGRIDEAEAAYRRALELAPNTSQPYLNLAHVLVEWGRTTEAVAICEQALGFGLDPDLFSQTRATFLRLNPPRAPDGWVKETFDNFAPTFESQLRSLGYDVPEKIARVIQAHLPAGANVLDLGCGTGLVGAALGASAICLVGVDLSEGMLAQAASRSIYTALHTAEVHTFVQGTGSGTFDGVCAADLFIYIGDLEAMFAAVGRVLKPGGWFIFSTEETKTPEYTLQPTGRYAHAQGYIERLAETTFLVAMSERISVRMERGHPVPGRLYALRLRT